MTGTSGSAVVFTCAAEGKTDAAVLERLVLETGAALGDIHEGKGRSWVLKRLPSYNAAARHQPWIVLVDLDQDDCAASLKETSLPEPAPLMCFRVAVREIEAWLMADREALAQFFAVDLTKIDLNPDRLPDPKESLVSLARNSRKAAIRREMVPAPGIKGRVGPGYTSRLIDFIQGPWRPEVASESSDSLRRCRLRLRELTTARPSPGSWA
jgi:hypothetical protein